MSNAPMFDPYGGQKEEAAQKPRPWWMTCLIGCGIVTLIIIVFLAFLAYYVSQNWRGWTSEAGAQFVMQMVNSSDLPDAEKQEIQLQVNRVAEAIRTKQMSLEQMGEIFEKLSQSPILTTIIVSTADTKYIDPSGLTNEEKAEAKITVHRFVRGVVDGAIDEQSTEAAMSHIAEKRSNGWRMRNSVTDDQLRAFLTEAKTAADTANIPAEPQEFDASDEVKRVIDEVMNERAAENVAPIEPVAPAEQVEPVEQP